MIMTTGNFRKNVIENLWEATISTGKSKELFYIRTESQFVARDSAEEHARDICGTLVSLKMVAEHGERIAEPTEVDLARTEE